MVPHVQWPRVTNGNIYGDNSYIYPYNIQDHHVCIL
jgi:hypothetical protein